MVGSMDEGRSAEALYAEAHALRGSGDVRAAAEAYLRVHELVPQAAGPLGWLGRMRRELDDLPGAEEAFRRSVALSPENSYLALGLGEVLLQAGRYGEAWPLYEARRRAVHGSALPVMAGTEWTGEPLAGAKLAVCLEQGFGDQLMFGRYLSRLSKMGAEVTVVLGVSNLRRIFEELGYRTAPLMENGLSPDTDLWIYQGSLPFRTGIAFPPDPAYLKISRKGGGGVGVVTAGSPRHVNDAHRSLPRESGKRLLKLGRDLSPAATGATDFATTAEIIADLDLVVSVDTSVAHLALAMGVPTIVLLPRRGLDWRWNDGRRSDWYPEATLLREDPVLGWESCLAKVEAVVQTQIVAPRR